MVVRVDFAGMGAATHAVDALTDPANLHAASLAGAESWVTDTLDWIGADKAFTPWNGGAGLEGAISFAPEGDGANVFANKDYAGYVEFGTGVPAGHEPWTIEPKPGRKALKIPNGGVTSPHGPQMPGKGYELRRKVIMQGAEAKPFLYADRDARIEHVKEAVLDLLMHKVAEA